MVLKLTKNSKKPKYLHDMMSEVVCAGSSHDASKDSVCLTSGQQDDDPDQDDLVFQCSQCNSIVGDSKAWKSANEISRTVSLRCASHKVRVTDKLLTSKTGDDLGSTYSLLECEVCKEEIGKMYRTTPSHLDPIRGTYTFYVDKLTSYQVGNYDQTCEGLDLSDVLTLPDTKRLHQQLQKLQAIIVCMDQRLKCIEKVMREDGEDIPLPTGNSSIIENNYSPEPVSHRNEDLHSTGKENNTNGEFTPRHRDKSMEQHQTGNKQYIANRRDNYFSPHGNIGTSISPDMQNSPSSPDVDALKRKLNSMSQGKVSSSSDKKRKRIK